MIWSTSSCAPGVAVPCLGAYASSKAAIDTLALAYAGELARWGIETSIVVPSALGPGHYVRSGRPTVPARAEEYADGPTGDVTETALAGLAQFSPRDRAPQDVARAIVDVVNIPLGRRPLRVDFDADCDCAAAIDAVAGPASAEVLRRLGQEDFFSPVIIG